MTGRFLAARLERVGGAVELAAHAVAVGLRRFLRLRLVLHLDRLAVSSLPIVILTALFSSVVMTIQIGAQFERFGNVDLVGPVVTMAIVKELGPVLAALTAGARVGAGIAAQIGSMTVTEQVDAIRAMGADPTEKLLSPLIIGCVLSFPLLTIVADAVGIAGSLLIANVEYHLDPLYFLNALTDRVETVSFVTGIIKSFFFGGIVGVIACYEGLCARRGTRGVGDAATNTVVLSAIVILFADLLLTTAFTRAGW